MELIPLTDGELEQLGTRGFFLRDHFLGEEQANAVFAQARALADSGKLKPGGIGRGWSRQINQGVRSDETLWLDSGSGALPAELDRLPSAFQWLRDELNRQAYLGLRRFELQLSHFPPNSRYQRHLDALAGLANRRATAIYYLNPGWSPKDGGQLRLFLDDSSALVDPILDRLVVFISEQLAHEVLTVFRSRLAVTAWYYSNPA